MKKKEVFAKGVCFKKLFIIFVIGCLFGNYYEMILNFVREYLKDGTIFWEVRRGVIYGPFSPVYGLGAVVITKLLADKNYKWWKIFIYGALLGGLVEYIISFLQEKFVGTLSWNYGNGILSLNGRTHINIMIVWGIICIVFVKIVYPFLSKLIEKIPVKIGNIIYYILLVFLSLDMFISFSAVIRQSLRRNDIPPYTFYGEFLDKYYTDERLKKAYPNMWVVRK